MKDDVVELIERAARRADCRVSPARGLPNVRPGLVLPADVVAFYDRCGGFAFTSWELAVVGPERFVPTDEVVVDAVQYDELTAGCYLVVEEPDGSELATSVRAAIDLNPKRAGRCYDVFWDSYGDSMPVIALSFTELVRRLLEWDDDEEDDETTPAYWNNEFHLYGGAYDDCEPAE